MKKKMKTFMMALTLCSMLSGFTTTVNAAEIAPMGVICIQHGPWSYYCGGGTTSSSSHSFTYQGYAKVCNYTSSSAVTMMKCDICGYYTGAGSHSHGESGHTTSICGRTNSSYCYY